jgi:hypothetical protein
VGRFGRCQGEEAPTWLARTSVAGQRPLPARRSRGWLVCRHVAADPGATGKHVRRTTRRGGRGPPSPDIAQSLADQQNADLARIRIGPVDFGSPDKSELTA